MLSIKFFCAKLLHHVTLVSQKNSKNTVHEKQLWSKLEIVFTNIRSFSSEFGVFHTPLIILPLWQNYSIPKKLFSKSLQVLRLKIAKVIHESWWSSLSSHKVFCWMKMNLIIKKLKNNIKLCYEILKLRLNSEIWKKFMLQNLRDEKLYS